MRLNDLSTDEIIKLFVEAWDSVPRGDFIRTPKCVKRKRGKRKDKRKTKLPEPIKNG